MFDLKKDNALLNIICYVVFACMLMFISFVCGMKNPYVNTKTVEKHKDTLVFQVSPIVFDTIKVVSSVAPVEVMPLRIKTEPVKVDINVNDSLVFIK